MKDIFNKILTSIVFSIVYSFGFILGKLPRFAHLLFADILYVLLYKIARYRVKVTRTNLKNAFPEKSHKERREIERRFYLYLSDVFFESIILIGISKLRMKKKMIFHGAEEFEAARKDKPVIITMAHYGSWEWTSFYSSMTDDKIFAVYHILASEWAEKFYYKVRSRFGAHPVPMQLVGRKLIELKRKNGMLILIADQAPTRRERSKWVKFLNQDTMFYSGPEVIAKTFKMPVFYFSMDSTRRGYYEGEFIQLYDGVEEVEEYEIMGRYQRELEAQIKRKPHLWVWSHRRWKRKPPAGTVVEE